MHYCHADQMESNVQGVQEAEEVAAARCFTEVPSTGLTPGSGWQQYTSHTSFVLLVMIAAFTNMTVR